MAVPDRQWSFRDTEEPDDPLVPPVRSEPAEEDPLLSAIGQMANAILSQGDEPRVPAADEPPARDEPPQNVPAEQPPVEIPIPVPPVPIEPSPPMPWAWRLSQIAPALLMVLVVGALVLLGFRALGDSEL
jgi:hypothetical protein